MFASNQLAKCVSIAAGIHKVLEAPLVESRGNDPEALALFI